MDPERQGPPSHSLLSLSSLLSNLCGLSSLSLVPLSGLSLSLPTIKAIGFFLGGGVTTVRDKVLALDNVKEPRSLTKREEMQRQKLRAKKRSKMIKAKEKREKNMLKMPEDALKYKCYPLLRPKALCSALCTAYATDLRCPGMSCTFHCTLCGKIIWPPHSTTPRGASPCHLFQGGTNIRSQICTDCQDSEGRYAWVLY